MTHIVTLYHCGFLALSYIHVKAKLLKTKAEGVKTKGKSQGS